MGGSKRAKKYSTLGGELARTEFAQDLLNIVSGWFNNEAHSDLVQLQDEQVVHCHKSLLSSRSDVWAAVLEEGSAILELTSYDAETTKSCLEYCYTGDIALTEGNLMKVHHFALCYHLQGLQSLCETIMQEQLTTKNCVSTYSHLGAIPSLPAARKAAKSMVCRNFATLAQDPSFYELSTQALCELLKSREIFASEDAILQACCRWIDNKQPAVNLQAKERVLQLIRFSQLSPKVLLEFKSHELMAQSQVVADHHQLGLEWQVTEQAGPDREALQEAMMKRKKHVAFRPRLWLDIDSLILNAEMTRRLDLMLGRSLKAKLLLRTPFTAFDAEPQHPILCVIQDDKGHVFGCYCETFRFNPDFTPGSNNNFLFSLKEVGSQKVVKLTLHGVDWMVICREQLSLSGLDVFPDHCSRDDPAVFRLAAGYEGPRTLHGRFGKFVPTLIEIFSVETINADLY